jgi:hypothetical protein
MVAARRVAEAASAINEVASARIKRRGERWFRDLKIDIYK